jgi:hypothetical protein
VEHSNSYPPKSARTIEVRPSIRQPRTQQFPERIRAGKFGNGRRVSKSPASFTNHTGTCYTVKTSAGEFRVVDDGARWKPGDPIPEGRQPNALRALARHAERHAEESCEEERRAA